MKKRKLLIPLIVIAALFVTILILSAIANYKPLVFKKEIPYYGEKLVVELRENFAGYDLKVYKTTSFGIFKGKKTLLERENFVNNRHGAINTEAIKIGGEANTMEISIPYGHGYYRTIKCRIT